jgi:hypothetical protein
VEKKSAVREVKSLPNLVIDFVSEFSSGFAETTQGKEDII